MTGPLLMTKLHIPSPRPNWVPRPRLLARLDEAIRLGRRLILVSAPAGFGKTTLLGEWTHTLGAQQATPPQPEEQDQGTVTPLLRVAWLSLDEADNDPARFLAYLVAALQSINPASGEGTPAALHGPRVPPAEVILAPLINDLAALPERRVLILDDYHAIKARPVHSALAFLLDHLPPQMHLVIAGRADPPVHLARLRARGQLSELRQADLRFTHDEAAGFLNHLMGLNLAAEEVAALAARTEGWIAGLQMAAVSMQGRDDAAGFVQAFTGSNRFILDYLVEEVLEHQPESVQAFLLRTSILDGLAAPLCNAVTGQTDGQAILEMLERNNLFIVPLDDERRWYRYHRLFTDLLRQRLQQTAPDLLPTLHRRAGEWHEQRGLTAIAIAHALAAQDFERAARLTEQAAEATLMRGEMATFLGWVEALPDEWVRSRPVLSLFFACGLFLAGQPIKAVEAHLQDAKGGGRSVASRAASLHAFIVLLQGQVSLAAELACRALVELPEEDAFWRSVAAWTLSASRLVDLDPGARSRELEDLVRRSREAGNLMVALWALCHLAEAHVAQGQLHQAKEIYGQALELASSPQGRLPPIAGEALLGLGELHREWDDLATATRYLTEGIELTREWRFSALEGYVTLARIRQAQGDGEGAREAMQTAQELARQFDATELDDLAVAMHRARLAIAQGDLGAAGRWAEERMPGGDAVPAELMGGADSLEAHLYKYERLVLARLLIARGQPGEALALLQPLLPAMEQQGRQGLVIEILTLNALALQAQGNVAGAATTLARALALAEPGGYMRLFVDEGVALAALLREQRRKELGGAEAPGAPNRAMLAYIDRLLLAFQPQEHLSSPSPSVPLVEPLSERELQVLRLIASGLPNQEIARQLFITLRTVKWHTGNIYGKLGARNRTEAVARARALGILAGA